MNSLRNAVRRYLGGEDMVDKFLENLAAHGLQVTFVGRGDGVSYKERALNAEGRLESIGEALRGHAEVKEYLKEIGLE